VIESHLKLEGVEIASLNPFVKEIRDLPKSILKPYMINRIVEIVRRDQRSHIDQQKQVGGGALRKGMKKSGMSLVKTGLLYRSITGEVNSKGGRVFIQGERAKVGRWLHYGTKRMKAFNWWGVDDKTEKSVMEYLIKEIKFDG